MTENNNWNLWDYFYYSTTLYHKKFESKLGLESNKNQGSFLVGLLISLNVESILLIIIILSFKKDAAFLDYLSYVVSVIFFGIVFYSKYLYEKKRHDLIFKKYGDESKKQRTYRRKGMFAYVLFTILLLSITVYLGREVWE